jgi:two-component system CheB/CheR fusion protein
MGANGRAAKPVSKVKGAAGEESANGRSGGPLPCVAFPIVGVGASAGGLEAFTQLLGLIPGDTGMAFVLIQHLDPTHKSFLGEALARATSMPVREAVDGDRLEPNHVYVIPPNGDLSIQKGTLSLLSRADSARGLHLPIDFFFSALAAECGSRGIGVVLSGTASDGTEGLKAIKAEGGITFAQDPRTAKFPGMPQSAIDAGVVDFPLSISTLAEELARLSHHSYVTAFKTTEAPPARASGARSRGNGKETILMKIMGIVRSVAGIDFREYKLPTLERRLARRMALRKFEDQGKYLELLSRDPDEVRALCEETLIHVSSFFRDPEVFETLKSAVFPAVLKNKEEGSTIRMWVAGCSSGEEVYSLAICLLEALGDSAQRHQIQIFGSDVSERVIQIARAGRYSEGAMLGISEEQRRRYFTKQDNGFRITKSVRDLCVFVRHDLARDPPLTRMDLISCRNVLIYFDQPLQKRLIPIFHHSLNHPGFLLLGRAEHISGFGQLFSPLDKARNVFSRSASSSLRTVSPRAPGPVLPGAEIAAAAAAAAAAGGEFPRRPGDVGRHLDNLLLARYAPPGVLVNDKLEILQFRGQTGSYLQPAPGEPQSNLIKMARGGLLSKLRATLARAKLEMTAVRTNGVEVDQDGSTKTCDIVVVPFSGLSEVKEQLYIVLFEPASSDAPGSAKSAKAGRTGRKLPALAKNRKAQMETDARWSPKVRSDPSETTEYLQTLIEEHNRTNEELGSANEELVSGNEELQSLNEELETAKEELQSTNEELTTVNDELQSRNVEVSQVNSDLVNVLDTVDLPVVILDKHRHIRRFTPKARNVLNILPSDVGRLFDEIKPNIEVADLDRQIGEVISTYVAKESEVQDREGRWHRMQIRPYKATDGAIDGAILSLVDIDALKNHVTEAQQGQEVAERADRAKDQFLAVLSHELRTPLSALMLQTQMLRVVGSNDVQRQRAYDAIERSTQLQAQLVDDLLDVSRIVTGKMRVDRQPLDLDALVRVAIDNSAPLAEKKSITLKATFDRSVRMISGDRTRLAQVLSNLLGNAIKFTPDRGRIDVSLTSTAEMIELRVTDTGVGIEPRFLPRVFNRLTQEDSSSTRPYAGLGLGLAIVRHLVDAHGGKVRAESAGAGQGSTFVVTLPLLKPVAEVVAESIAPPTKIRAGGEANAGRLAGRRVLVLEDDANVRLALADLLAYTGAIVRTAESVAVAMSVFEEFHPQLLLCDIAMPVEDGYSFIRRIRALSAAKGGDTPGLALTALAGELDRARSLSEGFQMHLTKPVDMDRLIGSAAALLEGVQASEPPN